MGPDKKQNSQLWKLKTAAYKKKIYLQEYFGLYNYQRWIDEYEGRAGDINQSATSSKSSVHQSMISFLIPYKTGSFDDLLLTLDGLNAQTYHNWEAHLSFDSRLAHELGNLHEKSKQEGARIHLHELAAYREHVDPMINALEKASGDYVILVNVGDRPAPNLLDEITNSLNISPEHDIVYYDEDTLASDGVTRQDPFFKPDWSPELMLSTNYLTHAAFRRSLLDKIINQAALIEPDFGDLIFRCIEKTAHIHHIPKVLYHKGQSDRTGHVGSNLASHPRRVKKHLQRVGIKDASTSISEAGETKVSWPVDERLVSIIIPTKDHVEYLQTCMSSIQKLTAYNNYEIILVDSGSEEYLTQKYYAEIQNDPAILIVEYEPGGAFNFNTALNTGARHARGEILLFLNNDTEVIHHDWLDEIVRWANRPEIGVVGAKLLYPDGTIQHAGIVVGLEGHASHVFSGMQEGSSGPYGSVEWYRNYSAVTGACMALRRDVFDQIGGFSEEYRLVFSDVEICLRAIKAGYRNVYTPYAKLIHHEGKSRASYMPYEDLQLGYSHFKIMVENGDPYYNPNISHAVRKPTLKRADEEAPITRLQNILQYYSNK